MFKAYDEIENDGNNCVSIPPNNELESGEISHYDTYQRCINSYNTFDPIDFYMSDTSDDDRSRKKRKKNRHKNILELIKEHTKNISKITDRKCPYYGRVFLRDLSQDERDENCLLDNKGNPQLGRYGCVYEKHVPKYRKARKNLDIDYTKPVEKGKGRTRYYNYKDLDKNQIILPFDQQEIRQVCCGENCICRNNSEFIPFKSGSFLTDSTIKTSSELIQDKATELNDLLNRSPQNPTAWQQLVELQTELVEKCGFQEQTQKGSLKKTIVLEKKLSILEKAVKHCSYSFELQIMRLIVWEQLFDVEKAEKEWERMIFISTTNLKMWRAYFDYLQRQRPRFSIEKIVQAYGKCFSNFYNIMSGRNKSKSISSSTIIELIDLLSDCCWLLGQSGHVARATCIWQANIEWNLFCENNAAPRNWGLLMDDPIWRRFSDFWGSGRKRIGEPGCQGWGSNSQQQFPDILRKDLRNFINHTEFQVINSSQSSSKSSFWIHLEQTRSLGNWLPSPLTNDEEEEDEDTDIGFSQIRHFLITLHNPQNVVDNQLTRKDFHRHMIIKFLGFLGINTDYSIPALVDLKRHALPLFLHNVLDKLAPICQEADNCDFLSIYELKYHFSMSLHADNWKTALNSIKTAAKRILAPKPGTTGQNYDLWIQYTELLLMLPNHDLFKGTNKAMNVAKNEINKVIQGLIQQITIIPKKQQFSVIFCYLHFILLNPYASDVTQSNFKVISSTLSSIMIGMLPKEKCKFRFSLVDPNNSDNLLELFDWMVINNAVTDKSLQLSDWWSGLVACEAFRCIVSLSSEKFLYWTSTNLLTSLLTVATNQKWSSQFTDQLSRLLCFILQSHYWKYSDNELKLPHFSRSFLDIFISCIDNVTNNKEVGERNLVEEVFTENLLKQVLNTTLSNKCSTDQNSTGSHMLKQRNFIWKILSAITKSPSMLPCYSKNDSNSNLAAITSSNKCQQALLLCEIELNRFYTGCYVNSDNNSNYELSVGINRIRSLFERLFELRQIGWINRLVLWLQLLKFESDIIGKTITQVSNETDLKRYEKLTDVFYRAVTDLPGCKSIYLAGASLLPEESLSEILSLMKHSKVKLYTTLEEVELMIRIRDEKRMMTIDDA